MIDFNTAFKQCPIIAILRGVHPKSVIAVAEHLYAVGIKIVEVPLNSPSPFESIACLSQHFAGKMVVGGGTVVTRKDVLGVIEHGGTLCVSPNVDKQVISTALDQGVVSIPGFFTVTEALAAIQAGATCLKFFPATDNLNMFKAMQDVLPKQAKIIAVGGVDSRSLTHCFESGFDGVGIGGGLYKPTYSLEDIGNRTSSVMAAFGHYKNNRHLECELV